MSAAAPVRLLIHPKLIRERGKLCPQLRRHALPFASCEFVKNPGSDLRLLPFDLEGLASLHQYVPGRRDHLIHLFLLEDLPRKAKHLHKSSLENSNEQAALIGDLQTPDVPIAIVAGDSQGERSGFYEDQAGQRPRYSSVAVLEGVNL